MTTSKVLDRLGSAPGGIEAQITMLLLFNKPYGVLCQFSPDKETAAPDQKTLKDFVPRAGVYPAGRLDKDSEGLLALTDDGALQNRLSHPKRKLGKTYLVQVEGQVQRASIEALSRGVLLKDGPTLPAQVELTDEPRELWPREPPVKDGLATSWLRIVLKEGRNRQVRRMTAAVGHPTLRLIRTAIGPFGLETLLPGQWREVPPQQLRGSLKW